MKPKTPTCTNCNHETYCLHKYLYGIPKKCGCKNKPVERNILSTNLIKNIQKMNSITPKSPDTCLKTIEPLFKTSEHKNSCDLCAHYIWNCEGKKK